MDIHAAKGNNNDTDSSKLNAVDIIVKARDSLSEFCYTECNSYCCRNGYLLLTRKQFMLLTGNTEESMDRSKNKIVNNKYVLNLGSMNFGCSQLVNLRCAIHANIHRPKACKEFPIFLWKGKTIRVSGRCLGVQTNRLYPFLANLKSMGYNISYG